MRVAFVTSSYGDTDLACQSIRSLDDGAEVVLILLTEAAQNKAADFSSPRVIAKKTASDLFGGSGSEEERVDRLLSCIREHAVQQVYLGVPSESNSIPFQIAERLDDIPVLIAYEFMFKPISHCLWDYLPKLQDKMNVHWALPLYGAITDFISVSMARLHVIGHLSIDSAYIPRAAGLMSITDIRVGLQVKPADSLAFMSGTTQPMHVDIDFLQAVLSELPAHPTVQLRLGIHPGIREADAYLARIIEVYQHHSDAVSQQFKVTIPEKLKDKIKHPALTIVHPDHRALFLIDIEGPDVAYAAERVTQAVPGALLTQAALMGKSVYAPSGQCYLPSHYFVTSLGGFFTTPQQPVHAKKELDLDETTAAARCAKLFNSLDPA